MTTIGILVVYALKGMGKERTFNEQEKFDKYKEQEHLPKRFRVEQYIKAEFNAYQEMNLVKLPEEIKEDLLNMANNIERFISVYEREHLDLNRKISENNDELDEERQGYYELVEGKYLFEIVFSLEEYSYFQVIGRNTKNQIIKAMLSNPEIINMLKQKLNIGSDCGIEFWFQ